MVKLWGRNSFQKIGVMERYKAKNPAEGHSSVPGKGADRFKFKVASTA
jgi:cytochrome c peroxidase